MKWNKIQLMIYGENLKDIKASFNDAKIKILKVHQTENPSYAFIDIEIPSDLKPGEYKLKLEKNGSKIEFSYPILQRNNNDKIHQGLNADDVIYLIMPDRFANGDTSNDVVDGYGNDLDRSKGIARHGGDLQGIIDHLDYIKDLGFTAIWINPVIENNTGMSYHGYAATDFYKTDPRLGNNELYKKLVEEAHKRGVKIILDHVANHIHVNHPWMKNLPFKDLPNEQAGWINGSPENFERTNHDKVAIVDVHGDESTLKNSTNGWFTDYMPDLNQKNQFMANYIIQNTIWWMEYAGIDGIREDTYPYADPEFMSEWAEAIIKEYPATNIFGEVWKGDPVFLSTYQEKSVLTYPFDSNLPSVTDFALSDVLRAYLKGSGNLLKIYEIIGMDLLYHDPYKLVTFIDNHDIERAMFTANEDVSKVKIALQILLTTRGIPQILYATEIGAVGGADHGSLRMDFPGGFPGDTLNAFTPEGRTEKENDIFNFLQKILQIREENKPLSNGKLIHFPPKEDIYIYFRILNNEKIMIVVNDNKEEKQVDLKPVLHLLKEVVSLKELKSGNEFRFNGSSVTVKSQDVNIYKLIEKYSP
jgi:glycosidase